MSKPASVLHLFCGKIASGKSTLAAALSDQKTTVRLSEDEWLSALFSGEISDINDYMRSASKLQHAMTPHVVALLEAGVSVVLDFPANTVESRLWMRRIVEATSAAHQLHVLDVPDDICLERLRARNQAGAHPFAATEKQFHFITKHLVLPTAEEGFNVVVHQNRR